MIIAAAVGTGFVRKGMGFQNTAGPDRHYASKSPIRHVCIYITAKSMDIKTSYILNPTPVFPSCVISSNVDFIFDDGAITLTVYHYQNVRSMSGKYSHCTRGNRQT